MEKGAGTGKGGQAIDSRIGGPDMIQIYSGWFSLPRELSDNIKLQYLHPYFPPAGQGVVGQWAWYLTGWAMSPLSVLQSTGVEYDTELHLSSNQ